MNEIGRNIQALRTAAGLSKEELARRIGKTGVAVAQYERGETTPRMPVIDDIARVFGVTRADIVEGPGEAVRLSAEEAELISDYRAMDEEGRRTTRHVARAVRACDGRDAGGENAS